MKKSYSIMPFPLFVVSYIALALCIPLLCLGRISLLALLIAIIVTFFIVTFKISYQVIPASSELKIYKEIAFCKFNLITLKPNLVLIYSLTVKKRKISGKYGGGGPVYYTTQNLVIYDKHDNNVTYEKGGYRDHLEELAVFISESLKIELKYKNMRAKDDEKPAVV